MCKYTNAIGTKLIEPVGMEIDYHWLNEKYEYGAGPETEYRHV